MAKQSHKAEDWDWRYGLGLLLFALAGLSIVAGVVAVFAGQARHDSPDSPIWLLAGAAEILCLAAAAILGKEKYQKLSRRVRRQAQTSEPDRRTRRFRYYLGLAGCLFNGIPLTLYAYVPELMPGGNAKLGILIVADLVFFGSLFFAGGEFWEKLRRLFVWEGK
jgi:drug/metabolite transporter (DMT)-like permease